MGERKVLNKYYPPDFDPAKIPRRKNDKNKQIKVRMMLPMSIRCTTCGTYIYKGTKFNSRKEDVVGETYLGIQIFRFYFKCTKCSAELTMKTDPQNSDYVVESGAARNFEPWRAEDEMSDIDRKQREAEEMGDAMKTLENKALDSKKDMDILAALEEMKSMKTRHETVRPEDLLEVLKRRENNQREKLVEEIEEEDDAVIKSITFHNSKDFVRRIQDDDEEDLEDDHGSSNLEDHDTKTYLGIQIFRFYFKCTKCSAELTMKTDPQNSDYVVESGAARNFEPWRAEDEISDIDRKQREAEEMGDAMKTLENKALDSKKDMDILAALEEMKSMKTRHETVRPEDLLEVLKCRENNQREKLAEEIEEEDDAFIKSITFHNSKDFVRRIQDDDEEDLEDDHGSSNLEDHDTKRKRTIGNPTDTLTPVSIFNISKTGDGGGLVSKPKFILKPRTAADGAKRLRVVPTESDDKRNDEANPLEQSKGSGNVLQSLCANYDSDEDE